MGSSRFGDDRHWNGVSTAGGGARVEDENPSLEAEWVADSDVVLVAFGGLGPMHRYRNFFRYTKRMLAMAAGGHPVNMLNLSDATYSWYHHGAPGVANNLDDLASYLVGLIEEHRLRRVVFLGVSSGGYAALLLGWLLDVYEVHAIVPGTFVDMKNRLRHNDWRTIKLIKKLQNSGQPQYFDLREVFVGGPAPATQFHIYFGQYNRIDNLHATRMADIPNVHLHGLDARTHFLGGRLRDLGELDKLLAKALRHGA